MPGSQHGLISVHGFGSFGHRGLYLKPTLQLVALVGHAKRMHFLGGHIVSWWNSLPYAM